jgi:tetratricopeptide (TPR) repeat protein
LLGDLEQALVEIDRAIALQPKYGEFRWSRARILEMLGRVDDARSELEMCATVAAGTRDEAQARRDLMRLALARGDNSDALLQCRAIVALEPRNADMIANLGSLLAAVGDQEQGRRELRRALQLRPMFSSDQTLLRAAIAYLRLAIPIKLDARELAEAAATVETLRTFAPNDPGTRFFDLAVQLNAGDTSARTKIEAMEREARAVGESAATAFADELAAFLAKRPADAQ